MAKTLGYMITWTTYGSWLQGDKRGFVKKGMTCPANKSLADSNKASLTKKPVRLSKTHRQIVQDAILQKAASLNQRIHALSVSSNHVHILAEYIALPIGQVVSHYKSAAQAALRKAGVAGRVWTRGFDKRYCFDQQGLRTRIDYVNSHNRKPPIISPQIYLGVDFGLES
ncbi:MAG: transposase [Planctomycetota bacterium]|jgi:REP element-mobilizing transposase RayT